MCFRSPHIVTWCDDGVMMVARVRYMEIISSESKHYALQLHVSARKDVVRVKPDMTVDAGDAQAVISWTGRGSWSQRYDS